MNETNTTTTPAPVASQPSHKAECVCWCGCGGMTKSRFVPGHDARFHGVVKKVMRGELDADTELAKLPHDAAREEFLAFAAKQQPKEDERNRKLAEKAKAKADAKAAKEAAKKPPVAAPVAGTTVAVPGTAVVIPQPETALVA